MRVLVTASYLPGHRGVRATGRATHNFHFVSSSTTEITGLDTDGRIRRVRQTAGLENVQLIQLLIPGQNRRRPKNYSINQSSGFYSFCSHGLDKMTRINEHIYIKMSNENVNTVHVNYLIQKHSWEISQDM